MIKKSCFFYLEILEIHQKTNNEQESKTISDTLRTEKQNSLTEMNRQFLKIEIPQLLTKQSKHQHKNKKINLENLKRIMNE